MLNHKEICNLIYKNRTKEACIKALNLLSKSEEGLEEAIRYLYMRDAYFRLKDKEQVAKCGRLVHKYTEQYFKGKKIISEEILYNQCIIIKDRLIYVGKCNISIMAHVGEKNDFRIILENSDYKENILTPALAEEIADKLNNKIEGERFLYYRAILPEIRSFLKTAIAKDLYSEVKINITRAA